MKAYKQRAKGAGGMKLTKHNRAKLTKLIGKCTVGWGAVETCVITCDLKAEHDVNDYLDGLGYSVVSRQHPRNGFKPDLTRIRVTGEKELAE